MKKTDFNDGICDECGNTGLAGEKCIVCGGVLAKIGGEDLTGQEGDDMEKDKDEPEVYPLEVLDQEEEGFEKDDL